MATEFANLMQNFKILENKISKYLKINLTLASVTTIDTIILECCFQNVNNALKFGFTTAL